MNGLLPLYFWPRPWWIVLRPSVSALVLLHHLTQEVLGQLVRRRL